MQRAIRAMCSTETYIMRVPIERCPELPVRLCKAFQSVQRKMIKDMGRKNSKPEVAGMNRSGEYSVLRAVSRTSLLSDHGQKLQCALVGY